MNKSDTIFLLKTLPELKEMFVENYCNRRVIIEFVEGPFKGAKHEFGLKTFTFDADSFMKLYKKNKLDLEDAGFEVFFAHG